MSAGDAAVSIPWDRLRAWIDQQEHVESLVQHAPPPGARLSRSQLQALSQLIDLVPAEPDLDSTDYVSTLLCLTQSRKLRPPAFHDLEAVDLPTAGVFFPRWRTVCVLPSAVDFPGGFPAVGFGLETADKGLPLFKSKKLAKQYAAKHALAFLTSMPTPPRAPQEQQQQQRTPPLENFSRVGGNAVPSSAVGPVGSMPTPRRASPALKREPESPERGAFSLPAAPPSGDFSSGDGPSVFTRVAALSTKLGLETPRFETHEEKQLGVFSGFAVFRGFVTMPPEMGRVSGVLGKKNAKEQVAEQVLRWLEQEDAARRRTTEQVEKAMARHLDRDKRRGGEC